MATDPQQGLDNRDPYDWMSRWPRRAWIHIVIESIYVFSLLTFSCVSLLLVWLGWPAAQLSLTGERAASLDRYLYYTLGGLLGGTLFDIKWLYRGVARGLWHVDRVIWRVLSPLLSAGFALAASFAIEAGYIGQHLQGKNAAHVATGVLIGYFSDHAVAKMSDLADAAFGAPGKRGDQKT